MSQSTFWSTAVIYQIYPRSFNEVRPKDVADHGEGSVLGITKKLDYLKELGVEVIWLSPFYPSPMVDNGYDVMEYCDVDPRYGDLGDFDEMVREARARGMKVMVDFVPNHTSDQHPWFVESASSRDNPKSDWYIWRDACPDGSPPNNWASVFSKPQLEKRKNGELKVPDGEPTPPLSAWQWHEGRGQYYLHTFAVEQPDLDWSNPGVRSAMKAAMRFWVDRGVDGFRIDAVNHTGKDLTLTDEPANPDYVEGRDNPYDQLQRTRNANYKTLYGYLREMTSIFDEPAYASRDLYMVFEAYVAQPVLDRINAILPAKAAAFNFASMRAPWEAAVRRDMTEAYLEHLPAGSIPNHVNGNHDNDRLATRIGPDAARAAAVVNATLPGQMYIYQGEEAGFENATVPPELQDDHLGGRDPERTPIAWSDDKNGGFSMAERTWLPLAENYRTHNIASELQDPNSSWHLYEQLLWLRRDSPALLRGAYKSLAVSGRNIWAYTRISDDEQLIVVVNFADTPTRVQLGAEHSNGRILLSSLDTDRAGEALDPAGELALAGYEAVVIEHRN